MPQAYTGVIFKRKNQSNNMAQNNRCYEKRMHPERQSPRSRAKQFGDMRRTAKAARRICD
jgi:hypothetical protein